MSPVIVVRDGRVDAVVGSPGGPRILSAVMHVLLNRYVFGLDPAESVAAPRAHRQDQPEVLRLEDGLLSPAARVLLQNRGQPCAPIAGIGDVNAIFRVGESWAAVSDVRASGSGAVVASPALSDRK